MVALGAGGAMVLLKWHPTLGYGGLGAGVLLTLAGVAAGGRSPAGALSQRISRPLGALRLPGGKRTRAIVVATIIVGATLGTFLYGEYQLSSQSGSQFGLSLNVDSASEVTYPDGSVGVTVHVAAVGGIPPYTYTAVWGDNTDQTSTAGNFTRVFGAAFPVSTGLAITAKSSNSGLGYLFLSLPAQAPVISGIASTRTLTIVPSNGAGISRRRLRGQHADEGDRHLHRRGQRLHPHCRSDNRICLDGFSLIIHIERQWVRDAPL